MIEALLMLSGAQSQWFLQNVTKLKQIRPCVHKIESEIKKIEIPNVLYQVCCGFEVKNYWNQNQSYPHSYSRPTFCLVTTHKAIPSVIPSVIQSVIPSVIPSVISIGFLNKSSELETVNAMSGYVALGMKRHQNYR